MSTFTNSITNIANSGYITSALNSKQISQISESIKNGAIDTVSFSDESKNLFQISQIDTMLDGIFGIPNNLSQTQKDELEKLRSSLDTIFPTSSSKLQQTNFDEIFKNLGLNEGNKEQLQKLSNELSTYLTQNSISQLFGSDNSTDLSMFSNAYSNILGEKITTNESDQLGSLSLQLNRLLFDSNDNSTSSYLDIFNDMLGLNNPSDDDLFNASSLVTSRNTLLSSVLLNRSFQSSY
jgi:hypothetical protein